MLEKLDNRNVLGPPYPLGLETREMAKNNTLIQRGVKARINESMHQMCINTHGSYQNREKCFGFFSIQQ